MLQKSCALYHRVSTNEQDPTLARAELRRVAEQRGYTIALDVEETGSGKRHDRPELQRVISAARSAEISAVIVWKLDRLSRLGVVDTFRLIELFESAGVALISTSEGLDTGARNPMTDAQIAILSSAARMEIEKIAERTLLGIAEARRRGVKLGRPRHASTLTLDVLTLKREGLSQRAVAATLGVSKGTVAAMWSASDAEPSELQLAQLDAQLASARKRYNAK